MPLSSLANEVVIECLQQLDFNSLLAFAQTCKSYNNLVKDSATLQCIVELAASGCVLAPGRRPSKDLLERVKHHTEAWRTLSFTSQKNVFTSFAKYYGSVCCQVIHNRETSESRMVFYQPPALHRGVPERTWELSGAQYWAQNAFALDPARDLLVIVKLDVDGFGYANILSLRTGQPHETFGQDKALALGPLEDCNMGGMVDHILTVTGRYEGLAAYDICTRKRVPRPPLRPVSLSGECAVLFLPQYSIDVRAGPDDTFITIVRTLSADSSDSVECSLALPKFSSAVAGFHVEAFTPNSSESSGTMCPAAFLDDPTERILHLRFFALFNSGDHWERIKSVDIYVLMKVLLLHLPPADSPGEHTLSWEEWRGEDNCAIVESPADRSEGSIDRQSTCGARAVRLTSQEDPWSPHAIEVFDFHPRRVARANQTEVVRRSILPGRYLDNDQPLVTRLPYTVARYVLPESQQGYGQAVIMENAIIVYPRDVRFGIGPNREITTFCV